MLSEVTGCISISVFASSAVGIQIYTITAGIKMYKSIINKKKKKLNKIVLLGKDKLNTIEIPINKSLIDLYISHDEFALVNNALRKYIETKDEIKNPATSVEYLVKNNGNLLCQL